ncbi:MAG: RNA ligase family protein [Sulfuricaulis sp.]
MTDFIEFPKIARWTREIIITEKIDGTNGCIYIGEDGEFLTGSRSRWITPETDNHGFSRWAHEHKDELLKLGPGTHFGEWWGAGIQRRYGLTEKRFSLFNVTRWADDAIRPRCCHVVPVLYQGMMRPGEMENQCSALAAVGSFAARGFMDPEGVVLFHVPSRQLFKKTIEKDDEYKSKRP